jgi:hypothetical protein
MNLSLEREGEFVPVNMVENNTRCGQLGHMLYRYIVRVEATDERLSPEGFVIENGRLHNYFLTRYCDVKKKFNAVSCERMAVKAAHEIGKTLLKEKISVTSVQVTIFGSNNARLTAIWKNDLKAKRTRR